MDFTRRPRKVPTYRGEGQALRLSGTALILVGVVLSLGSLVVFGVTSPVLYVFLAIAAVLGAIGLRRNYLGGVFTEIEHRLGLPEAER
ncbi:hypothetical protein ACWEK5_43205 [Rhodococcus koreensis]